MEINAKTMSELSKVKKNEYDQNKIKNELPGILEKIRRCADCGINDITSYSYYKLSDKTINDLLNLGFTIRNDRNNTQIISW